MNEDIKSLPAPISSTPDTALHVYTLGGFSVLRSGKRIQPQEWGREKAVHLFQFLITTREDRQHKEQIFDRLWPDLSPQAGDRDFKVALNALNNALEPDRQPRAQPIYIKRNELLYSLASSRIWVDVDDFESSLKEGNYLVKQSPDQAAEHLRTALVFYRGQFLPERRYEDWSSTERERLTILALGAMTSLASLVINESPSESIRLTQRVLKIDPTWEDAYRIQMQAFFLQGNRPMAIRTYESCMKVIGDAFGVQPLPDTQKIYHDIINAG